MIAVNTERNILDEQRRTFKRRTFAGQSKRKQQRLFHHAGERTELQMHGAHTAAPLPQDHFFRALDDAQRNRQFVHTRYIVLIRM